MQCGLLKLPELVALAKYDGMQTVLGKGKGMDNVKKISRDKKSDKDIPFFFRKYTEKYPFGNVHMALRVGPLLVENGVAQ